MRNTLFIFIICKIICINSIMYAMKYDKYNEYYEYLLVYTCK